MAAPATMKEITVTTMFWKKVKSVDQNRVYRCKRAIESGDMKIIKIRENPQYLFLSKSAQWATETFGVKSVTILAERSSKE